MKHSQFTKVMTGVCLGTTVVVGAVYADNTMQPMMQGGGQGQSMMQGQGNYQNMMQGPQVQWGMMQQGAGQNMMQGQWQGQGGMMQGQSMQQGQGQQQGGPDFLRGFVRTDLTADQQTALRALLDAQRTTMDGLMKSVTPGTQPTADQIAALKAAQDKFISDLTPYIDATKLDAFKQAFAQMRPPMNGEDGQHGPQMGSGMMSNPQWPDFLRGFIRTDLTTVDQTALKAILDAQKTTMDALMKTLTPGTQPTADQITALNAARDKFISDLTPYINATKLDAFKQSMTTPKQPMNGQGQSMMQNGANAQMGNMMNTQGRNMNPNGMMQGQQVPAKYALSQNTKTQLAAKLDSIPADKQVDFFTALIAKIDALLAKTKGEKIRAQLTEIQNIVQDKLDALTGNTEDNILKNLMN